MQEIERIKEMRKRLDLTQKQLARLSGVSQSLIAKIEAKHIDPAYSKVQAILQALEQEMHKKQKVVTAKEIMSKPIVSITPGEKLADAMRLMRKKAISQLPVFEDANPVGTISEEFFVDWIIKYGERIDRISAREVMSTAFPVIPASARLEVVTSLLKHYKAILVKGESIEGIITKADLIKVIA